MRHIPTVTCPRCGWTLVKRVRDKAEHDYILRQHAPMCDSR